MKQAAVALSRARYLNEQAQMKERLNRIRDDMYTFALTRLKDPQKAAKLAELAVRAAAGTSRYK